MTFRSPQRRARPRDHAPHQHAPHQPPLRGRPAPGTSDQQAPTRRVRQFLRDNPQAFVLLVICLVLGLGTFIAVLIALATAGSTTATGEPSGMIAALHLLGR